MVQALSAFLEFCYLVRRASIDEDTLDAIENALTCFHETRKIFEEVGVWPTGFSLPRQHALKHYRRMIQQFGAPNGLCSSITESKHIKAVKEPWCRSNRYEALEPMLLSNQRIDKLDAMHTHFFTRGILNSPCPPNSSQPTTIPTNIGATDSNVDDNSAQPHDGPQVNDPGSWQR
jgi:hypothetical protein